MKRFLYFLLLTAVTFAAGCSDYDDSELGGHIDGFKERIARLQSRIASLNEQLADLSELTSGNVITAMTQDSEGNCVITYKDNKDEEKSVVLATVDQMLNVPLLGVEPDAESGLYYWTVTADGQTAPLLDKDGERVPVSGHTPVVSVDEQGFWTVNGERLNDAAGRPIEANDGESCLFREIARDANGNLSLTLGNGKVITLPIQQVLNLTLSTAINTTVVDTSAPMTVKYTLHGEHAADALVGIAAAEGVEAALDKEQQQIVVTFPAGFSAGHLIAVAYDMMEHTVLRPVFFAKAASDRIEIRTAAELVQFAADVNAGTGAQLMTAVLMNDIDLKDVAQWTPIGNGTFAATTAASTPSGAAFEGTFDGQGYALRNLKMEAALTGRQPGIRPVRRAERRDGQKPRAGSRKRRHGVVQGLGQRRHLDGRHRRSQRRIDDRGVHQLPPDGVSGQRRFEQTDDHGPRRLRLRSRHKRRNRHEAHRAEELRCHEGRAGSRQHQRVHLDAGGLHRGRLEHLAHIDFQKPHHTLCELRRHDRLDGPRFGHRGRSEHLYGRLRMREPRRHAEHLRRIGRRTPGQHHLYPRHLGRRSMAARTTATSLPPMPRPTPEGSSV